MKERELSSKADLSESLARVLGWEYKDVHIRNLYENYVRMGWLDKAGQEHLLPDFKRDFSAVERYILPLLKKLDCESALFFRGGRWEAHIHSNPSQGKVRSFSSEAPYAAQAMCEALLKAEAHD